MNEIITHIFPVDDNENEMVVIMELQEIGEKNLLCAQQKAC